MGYRNRVQSRVAGQQTISFWATRVEEIFGGRGIRRGGMQIADVVKQGWGWGPGNKSNSISMPLHNSSITLSAQALASPGRQSRHI